MSNYGGYPNMIDNTCIFIWFVTNKIRNFGIKYAQ